MSLLINMRIYSPEVMRTAGFYYKNLNDSTTSCMLCRLEISCWTNDMDPLTVHLERSPNCVFVRRKQPLNPVRVSSLSTTTDSMPQRSIKRQKIDISHSFCELECLKQCRSRTFSHWSYPRSFCHRLAEAGFLGCNIDDRVICLYCNLICHQWNVALDDPCEVHRKLSPDCPLVKSTFHLNYNKNKQKSPSFIQYINPQQRLASFSNCTKQEFTPVEKFVEAGFFYNNSKIICFYCNGSFDCWESGTPPLAEHIRQYPYCNYAKQLCSEELYDKVQRASKLLSWQPVLRELNTTNLRLNVLDEETISKCVADRLDLENTRNLEKKFGRSIVESCLKDQFQFKGDDFVVNSCDLAIACEIRQKQINLTNKEQMNIIIPSVSLKDVYEKRQIPLFNDSIESYSDMLKSFENDLQTCKNFRRATNHDFTEDITTSLEREHSLHSWPHINPSRRAMIVGGWRKSDSEYDTSECPYCDMKYNNWKSDDNPLQIHQYLSPFCPFVLSSNPFSSNPIPIRPIREHFTDEDVKNAESTPYIGLVQTKRHSVFELATRENSFERSSSNGSINSEQLARSGYFSTNYGRYIQCFYCNFRLFVTQRSLQSDQHFRYLHRALQCRYTQQLNDTDPYLSTQQASTKCTWCMTEDKRLTALPCRHFCLCKSCGQIKRLCPTCNERVTAYVIIYPA